MYVDGFVLPIPTKNLKAYKKMAALGCKVWMEYGALSYHECVLDDAQTMMGVPFPELSKTKKGETVVFAWIVYKNKKHRDTVNAKVMKDKRLCGVDPKKMPFDCNRMTYGGFTEIVGSK